MTKMLVTLLALLAGLPAGSQTIKASATSKAACLAAARRSLGLQAEVASCGKLIGDGSLDVVAFVRARQFKVVHKSWLWNTPVTRVVILRNVAQKWETALDADIKQITNSAGYILPMDSVDCSPVAYTADWGEALDFDDALPRGRVGAGIGLLILTANGEIERAGQFNIRWNPMVGRFQGYEGNYTTQAKEVRGRGFFSESKNLPPMFTMAPCHCATHNCNHLTY